MTNSLVDKNIMGPLHPNRRSLTSFDCMTKCGSESLPSKLEFAKTRLG
jgi:hypothetical protein